VCEGTWFPHAPLWGGVAHHRRQRNGFMALGGQSQTCFFSSFFAASPRKRRKKDIFGGLHPPNPRFAKRQAAKVDAYGGAHPCVHVLTCVQSPRAQGREYAHRCMPGASVWGARGRTPLAHPIECPPLSPTRSQYRMVVTVQGGVCGDFAPQTPLRQGVQRGEAALDTPPAHKARWFLAYCNEQYARMPPERLPLFCILI
jgi:hypothetical protein